MKKNIYWHLKKEKGQLFLTELQSINVQGIMETKNCQQANTTVITGEGRLTNGC